MRNDHHFLCNMVATSISLLGGRTPSIDGSISPSARQPRLPKKLPENFSSLQEDFLQRVQEAVVKHQVLMDLIINFDETGLPMVPSSQWTMAERGSKDVSLLDMDDKRQITAVLACTPTGTLLPPQLLYQCSTTRCHPPAHVLFPHGWDIWHSESHWSTRETVKRFISKILKPYADSVISELALPDSQRGLVILDVYAAHRTPDVLEEFQRNAFEVVFVPANCTSELQPLDLSFNGPLKEKCKDGFAQWYSQKVCDHLKERQEQGEEMSAAVEFQPDLRLSVIKPLHCRWLMDAYAEMSSRPQLVHQGWETGGIIEMLLKLAGRDGSDDMECEPHVRDSVLTTYGPWITCQ